MEVWDDNQLLEIEELIRKGQLNKAKALLVNLKPKQVPRPKAEKLGNLCRRVGLNLLALRILNPIVRQEKIDLDSANQFELSEYAICLQRIGALGEAMELLQNLDSNENPEVLLNLAFCCFGEWKYQEAVPYLLAYCKSDEISPYQKVVGNLNLAAAYVFIDRFSIARNILEQIHKSCEKNDWQTLLGNSLELRGQLEFNLKDFDQAKKYLEKSSNIFQQSQHSTEFFIQKWNALISGYESKSNLEPIRNLQNNALKLHHWETIRDCDYHLAKLEASNDIAAHLYFGTDFESYKHRIRSEFDIENKLTKDYIYSPSIGYYCKIEFNNYFDLKLGRNTQQNVIPTGNLIHKFLISLSKDFYRPQRLASLFSRLYPDEFFNPETSPPRIYQLISRVRNCLKVNNVGLQIDEVNGSYRLATDQKDVGLRISHSLSSSSTHENDFYQLQDLLKSKEFSAKQGQNVLNFSYGKMNRLIKWGLENQKLSQLGNGPRTRYKLIS